MANKRWSKNQVQIAWFLALADIRLRYARSTLGPFWITVQLAFFVGMLGVVLSQVHGVLIQDFLPFFAVSMMLWTFMSTSMVEGMEAMNAGGSLIKDRGVKPFVPILQTFLRSAIIMAHSMIVPFFIFLLFSRGSILGLIMAVPGFLIFAAVVAAATVCTATLGVRFRDFKRIFESLVLLVFLSTPILWQPSAVRTEGRFVVDWNPIAHLFAIWREPLLHQTFVLSSFGWSAVVLVIVGAGACVSAQRLRNAAVWI